MPIDIALDAFNASAMKTMRAFIHSKGKHIFRLTDTTSSLAVIVDFDHPRGREAIQDAQKRHQAVIALTREAQNEERYNDLIWVNKPVTPLTMIAAGEKLHRRFASEPSNAPAKEEAPERQWQKLTPENQWEKKKQTVKFTVSDNPYYDPAKTLQGYLQKAIDRSKAKGQPISLHTENRQLVIDANAGKVYFNFQMSVLKALCRFDLNDKNTHLATALHHQRQLNSKYVVMPLEKAQWEIALMCSRGRLPQGINTDQPCEQVQWPNFTRWYIPPHAMRIASVWMQGATCTEKLTENLNIEPYYVYSYLAAAHACDIVRPTASKSPASWTKSPQVTETRQVLRTLMRKLIGA